MVIGDQRADAELARPRHAFDARDAVVDGDQEIGLSRCREVHQLGREAIAELEAIRHQVIDARAEEPQRAHADRAGGGTVGVVVGDDQQALPRRDAVGEEPGRLLDAFQQEGRQQRCGAIGQLRRRADAAPGVDPGEQRMDTRLDERVAIDFLVRALDDFHA